MSGKIITAVAAAILLASTGLASAENQAPRHHHKEHPRYYNMVPNQAPADPAPYWEEDNSDFFSGTGVTGQGHGL